MQLPNLDGYPEETKLEIIKLLQQKQDYKRYRKIDDYKPYPFQKKFFAASKDGCKRRFLCAANR